MRRRRLRYADTDGFSHGADGAFLQPGNLRLRDAEASCHLHLGLAVIKAQGKNLLFPVSETRKGIPQGDMLHPGFVGIAHIANLIHDGQGVAPVGVDRVIQADGRAHRIQRLRNILGGERQLPGDLLQSRIAAKGGSQRLLALQHLVGDVPDGAADPDGAVVPQIPPHFSGNHGNDMQKAKYY